MLSKEKEWAQKLKFNLKFDKSFIVQATHEQTMSKCFLQTIRLFCFPADCRPYPVTSFSCLSLVTVPNKCGSSGTACGPPFHLWAFQGWQMLSVTT